MLCIIHTGDVVPRYLPSVNLIHNPGLNLVMEYVNDGFKFCEILLLLICEHNVVENAAFDVNTLHICGNLLLHRKKIPEI